MNRLLVFVSAMALAFGCSIEATASQIDLGSFSGTENLIDFSIPFERTESPLMYQGLLFSSINNVGSTDLAAIDNWGALFDNIPGSSGGYALNDFVGATKLRIQFTTDVNRFGLLLSTGRVATWSMIARDSDENFLEAINATMPGDTEATFLGLETFSNISYVDIIQFTDDGLCTIFDDLRFDSTNPNPVPIPSTILLLSTRLIGLSVLKRSFIKRYATIKGLRSKVVPSMYPGRLPPCLPIRGL